MSIKVSVTDVAQFAGKGRVTMKWLERTYETPSMESKKWSPPVWILPSSSNPQDILELRLLAPGVSNRYEVSVPSGGSTHEWVSSRDGSMTIRVSVSREAAENPTPPKPMSLKVTPLAVTNLSGAVPRVSVIFHGNTISNQGGNWNDTTRVDVDSSDLVSDAPILFHLEIEGAPPLTFRFGVKYFVSTSLFEDELKIPGFPVGLKLRIVTESGPKIRTVRHRTFCKYFKSSAGCKYGDNCAYPHYDTDVHFASAVSLDYHDQLSRQGTSDSMLGSHSSSSATFGPPPSGGSQIYPAQSFLFGAAASSYSLSSGQPFSEAPTAIGYTPSKTEWPYLHQKKHPTPPPPYDELVPPPPLHPPPPPAHQPPAPTFNVESTAITPVFLTGPVSQRRATSQASSLNDIVFKPPILLPPSYTPMESLEAAMQRPEISGTLCRLRNLPHILSVSKRVALDRISGQEGVVHPLSQDEALSVALYTFDLQTMSETTDGSDNFYYAVNDVLRTRESAALTLLRPFFYFFKCALMKLDKVTGTFYRGIPAHHAQQVNTQYKAGREVFWSSFTSLAARRDIAEIFASKDGPGGIVMAVQVVNARSLSYYSSVPCEDEVLLEPGAKLVVIEPLTAPGNPNGFGSLKLIQVQLEETAFIF